jgi:hypothetical protein
MAVSCRAGDDGLELSITLNRYETEALGHDAETVAELVDTLLWALGMLRAGVNSRDPGDPPPTAGDWLRVVADLERLPRRVEGAADAAIRAFAALSDRSDRLASAMKVDESDARRRLTRAAEEPAGVWEGWAGRHPGLPRRP